MPRFVSDRASAPVRATTIRRDNPLFARLHPTEQEAALEILAGPDPVPVNPETGQPPDAPTWTTKEGVTIPVPDMTDRHLGYAHRHCRRKAVKFGNMLEKVEAELANPRSRYRKSDLVAFSDLLRRWLKRLEYFTAILWWEMNQRGLKPMGL